VANDSLAQGASSAQFPASGGNISQEKWDAIWEEEPDAPMASPVPKSDHPIDDAIEAEIFKADTPYVFPNKPVVK
jgi:hypothetical protein